MGRFGFVQNRFQETFVTFLSLHKLWMAAPTVFSFASFYYAECWDFPDSLAAMVSVWPGSGQLHVSERSWRAIVIYFIVIIVCVVLDVEPGIHTCYERAPLLSYPLSPTTESSRKLLLKGHLSWHATLTFYPSSLYLPVWNVDFLPGDAAAIPWWWEQKLHAEGARRGRKREAIWSFRNVVGCCN